MNSKSLKDNRNIWASTRSVIEADNFKRKSGGKKSKSRWPLFVRVLKLFKPFFKISGLYRRGFKNTMSFKMNEYEVAFEDLPQNFDGFKILFLSDLHLDSVNGFENKIIEKLNNLDCDICLLGGDYRMANSGSFKNILEPFKKIIQSIKSFYGIYAVFGNHDTYLMETYEDEIGLKFLINESVTIIKEGQKLCITGTDDPFKFYTDQAIQALERSSKGFKIALIHTPELHQQASENGYSFYLCGHTHGGQICLPGGYPIITHQNEGKDFINGFWQSGLMKGYTSTGVGVSGLPVRFNCPGEIAVFKLKKMK